MTNPTGTGSVEAGGATSTPSAASRASDLADVFVSLADTLVADFDVVEMLDLLVRACVTLLGATAAGLLLGDQRGQLTVMSTSGESSLLLEMFQLQNDEGPCLDCYRSRSPVSERDLSAAADRWPRFVAAAQTLGFDSVHALPMRLRDETIGALNLFHSVGAPLDPGDLRIAQALADTATIGILQQRALRASNVLAEQLQTALNSRVAIEQAKGVLAAAGNLEMEAAFNALRRYARNHNLRLSDLAHDVATRAVDPALVLRR